MSDSPHELLDQTRARPVDNLSQQPPVQLFQTESDPQTGKVINELVNALVTSGASFTLKSTKPL